MSKAEGIRAGWWLRRKTVTLASIAHRANPTERDDAGSRIGQLAAKSLPVSRNA